MSTIQSRPRTLTPTRSNAVTRAPTNAPGTAPAVKLEKLVATAPARALASDTTVAGTRTGFLARGTATAQLLDQRLSVAPSAVAPGASPNPKLEALLQANPQIKTNQDLINHFYADGKGWQGLVDGCKANGISANDLVNHRQADVWSNIYPDGRPQAPTPPTTPANPTPPTTPTTPPTNPATTNPALAAFLDANPSVKTNQDFINHFYRQGGYSAFEKGCTDLGIKPSDVLNYRSAAIGDLAYPPPPPDGSLPTTAQAADPFHIVQFTDPKYNPTGPSSSANCGPSSLAMVLDAQGKMPAGLTPEQKTDYARALMNPTVTPSYITVRGERVPQLDRDHDLTGSGQIAAGAEQAGLDAKRESGWDALDTSLDAGRPVVAFGDCYGAWKQQFPTGDGARYGSGEVAHFIAIQGRTADGKYIVSDPMFTGGPVEMTREQLAVFFNKDNDNTPGFVSVGP